MNCTGSAVDLRHKKEGFHFFYGGIFGCSFKTLAFSGWTVLTVQEG